LVSRTTTFYGRKTEQALVLDRDEPANKAVGTVYLVGAGPGDPDLITVKGLRLIREADVIIYDRLAPSALLREARPDAELIDAGKLPTKRRLDQEDINSLLLDKARAGLTVVRLKGGDPFVFGRGGEEALVCHEAGIPFEVVPGVSSAIAVPAYAGIPVTQRNLSSAFTVFAGYEDPSKGESSIDYDALSCIARTGTLVALMGVAQLPKIAERLLAFGLDPNTPAVCIEWGTTDNQRVVDGTLATLPQLVADAGLQSPATTVIGAVAGLRRKGLRWFD
jgi:uroporphyrin-III C-methyltransferase